MLAALHVELNYYSSFEISFSKSFRPALRFINWDLKQLADLHPQCFLFGFVMLMRT